MRATLFLFASLSLGSAIGQTTFNVVQEHPSVLSYNGACSVFEQPDGYLVYSVGWALDSSVGATQITKYNLDGVFQWQKEHRRGNRSVYPGIIDPVAEISGNRYVAAMDEYGGVSPIVTYLYWWNSEGDTIRTRFMKSDSNAVDSNHGTRQLIALADGGFLHCGWCANTPPGQGGCITRLDSTGTILWERIYPQAEYIQNAREAPDGGFVLGGSRNAQQDEAVVIRTDGGGNVQWVRYHGQYSITGGYRALTTDDGRILMPGSSNPSPLWSDYDRWSCVFEYSAGGSLLQRHDYLYSENGEAQIMASKLGGHYWLAGLTRQFIVNPDYAATLWELDENLDSLWHRRYWYYAANAARNSLSCIRATSDGGLVMCGVARQGETDPLPYLWSNWLIKLDSYGCLVPGCHTVGIEEVALGLSEYLRIAPNPVAVGQPLSIRFEPPATFTAKGPLRVVLLDATGLTLQQGTMPSGVSAFTFPLSALPAGLYYLHVTDGTRWLAGGKVVVE